MVPPLGIEGPFSSSHLSPTLYIILSRLELQKAFLISLLPLLFAQQLCDLKHGLLLPALKQ